LELQQIPDVLMPLPTSSSSSSLAPEPARLDGMLELLVPAKMPGGTVLSQKRWCTVTSAGFQMFAPNRLPEDLEAPDLAIGFREMLDARPDAAPRDSGDSRRFCFRITFERAGNEAQTLLFVDRDQQRLNQWIVCLREGIERDWKGVPRKGGLLTSDRTQASKSKRALTSMVKKTETWWSKVSSFANRIDSAVEEVYNSVDFFAPKEEIESEFEDAASDSDDLSMRSEESDEAAAHARKGRWTSDELASRDRYLKEDQDLLDMLANDGVKHATPPAAAHKKTPQRADSEQTPIKRMPSTGIAAAGASGGGVPDLGAKSEIMCVGKRRGGSEVGGVRNGRAAHKRGNDSQDGKGRARASRSEINGGGALARGGEINDDGRESADDDTVSESTKPDSKGPSASPLSQEDNEKQDLQARRRRAERETRARIRAVQQQAARVEELLVRARARDSAVGGALARIQAQLKPRDATSDAGTAAASLTGSRHHRARSHAAPEGKTDLNSVPPCPSADATALGLIVGKEELELVLQRSVAANTALLAARRLSELRCAMGGRPYIIYRPSKSPALSP